MTIAQTADNIIGHPYFYELCAGSLEDMADMRIFLIDLMAHVSLQQTGKCHRAYNLNRNLNQPEISKAIRESGCAVNLDFKLSLPTKCTVIQFQNGKAKRATITKYNSGNLQEG